MRTPVTVTVTYADADGTTLLRMVGLANANLAYVADIPLVLHDDEYGTEIWRGFELRNGYSVVEKRATA